MSATVLTAGLLGGAVFNGAGAEPNTLSRLGYLKADHISSKYQLGPAVLAMGATTDGLQQLFAQPTEPWSLLRNWGMRGFDRSGPLKHWVARQAMGKATEPKQNLLKTGRP